MRIWSIGKLQLVVIFIRKFKFLFLSGKLSHPENKVSFGKTIANGNCINPCSTLTRIWISLTISGCLIAENTLIAVTINLNRELLKAVCDRCNNITDLQSGNISRILHSTLAYCVNLIESVQLETELSSLTVTDRKIEDDE